MFFRYIQRDDHRLGLVARFAQCEAKSNPADVVTAIEISKATLRKMKQNLGWAAGYNLTAIPVAAGAFAWAGITLRPEIGALAMSGSSIIVAFNATLLKRADLTEISD